MPSFFIFLNYPLADIYDKVTSSFFLQMAKDKARECTVNFWAKNLPKIIIIMVQNSFTNHEYHFWERCQLIKSSNHCQIKAYFEDRGICPSLGIFHDKISEKIWLSSSVVNVINWHNLILDSTFCNILLSFVSKISECKEGSLFKWAVS